MFRITHEKPCSDHLGNVYGSIKEMCAFWHIRPETYTRRINNYNMTVEEALTRPVRSNGGVKCRDHLGEQFYSKSSMCMHWGIDRKLYEYRISHGWSQKDALTKPSRQIGTTGK